MDTEWFKSRKRERKITDDALAAALGVERSVANKVVNGKVVFNARRADEVARLFKVSRDELLFRAGLSSHAPHPDAEPTRSADAGETAAVMRMDLSYAMGSGTNIDEHYIEGEPVQFDISFLRRLTPSPPHKLRIVSGTGDSMEPTIHDSEDLILDLNQRTLNLDGRIWAMSLFGMGAVKRLLATEAGRVLVVSDNPGHPNREVSMADIVIVGRVVGSVKRH